MVGKQKIILCDDSLVNIFLRLPIKAVFKFKCLSSKWNQQFSSQSFRNEYESLRERKHSKSNLLPLMGFFKGFDKKYIDNYKASVCFIPSCLGSMSIRSKEFVSKFRHCFAVSNNGVTLCGDGHGTYFVCNPMKDVWLKLPTPHKFSLDYWKYVMLLGFLYKEERRNEENVFSFSLVQINNLRSNHLELEIETYCSEDGFWKESKLRGATDFCLVQDDGCQVVGSTLCWTACSETMGFVFVAYNYKLDPRRVWLIQGCENFMYSNQRAVMGESTSTSSEGRLLCIRSAWICIKLYMLKNKLECYSYDTVVPLSEWVQIVELNIGIEYIAMPTVIAFHPQNSRFLLLTTYDSIIFWYDLELGESRSIWHPVPSGHLWLLPFFYPQCWPPLL